MSRAIVFDSAGTILNTVREVTDTKTHQLIPQAIETTFLTVEDPDRVLAVLNFRTDHLLEYDENTLLSSWMRDEQVSFGISFGRLDIDRSEIEKIINSDSLARVGDLQTAVNKCRNSVEMKEYLFALNGGIILNYRTKTIEFCIASAGRPFPGVKEVISTLHQMGISTYIASGDRVEKLKLVAKAIGISPDQVLGVATPGMKAELVKRLKQENNTVIMVGDGMNDIEALYSADIAILTIQENRNPPEILRNAADFVITDIKDVLKLIPEER